MAKLGNESRLVIKLHNERSKALVEKIKSDQPNLSDDFKRGFEEGMRNSRILLQDISVEMER